MGSKLNFYELDVCMEENGLNDDLYESLQHEDKAAAVVTALELLKKINKMPVIEKSLKLAGDSSSTCELAEFCLAVGDYKTAFSLYNQALCCAPKNNSLLKAYFGRSNLFYITQAYNPLACLVDIDRCLTWKNPEYQPMLKQMKAECQKRTIIPYNVLKFDKDFFTIDEKHPIVPCVSAAIDFIIENDQPKVVAGRNIPTGTVVAVEDAYIGHLNEINGTRACHYCHAFTLNLIPCDYCTHTLFCNEECKKLCWEAYHNVECHIINVLHTFSDTVIFGLSVKAALKLKNLCSWQEFITASKNLGFEQMISDLIAETYDVNNKLSILRCNNDRHFVVGATYNAAFVFATIIHYLERVPSFFPQNVQKKNDAIRALSRVLIHLFKAYGHIVATENGAKNFNSEIITTAQGKNFGLFSFTSKLKHSCDANLYVVGLNSKVALIALKPINSGEELTISIPGHWYEYQYQNRALTLFMISEIKCQCTVCVEGWSRNNLKSAKMNKEQQQAYQKWQRIKSDFSQRKVDRSVMYKETCQCMTALLNLPNTKEHKEIFEEFRNIIIVLQFRATNNFIVSSENDTRVNFI